MDTEYVFKLNVRFENKEQLLESLRVVLSDVKVSLEDGVREGVRVFSVVKDCPCEYAIEEDGWDPDVCLDVWGYC